MSDTSVDPQGTTPNNLDPVENKDIPTGGVERVLPRTVSTGVMRGTQLQGTNNYQADPSQARQLVNDNTTNRLVIGNIGTGVNDWGMKVSKPSVDVLTATDEQLIFNSSQNVFKIIQTGIIEVTSSALSRSAVGFVQSNSQIIVPHDLGYTPASIGFVNFGASYFNTPYHTAPSSTSDWVHHETVSIVTTDLYIIANVLSELSIFVAGATSTVAVVYPIKYYLLQETAN